MKTLVFSDTHLTDLVEPKLFKKLVFLISEVDRVIINGDFFEGYITNVDEFVNSGWSLLFPLLLKKETVFVYGNHDPQYLVGDKAKLFSQIQTDCYEMKFGNQEIIFIHGHTKAPEFDDTFPKITQRFQHHYHLIFNLHKSKLLFGRVYTYLKNFHYRAMMRKIGQYALEELKDNQILIAGHSHQNIDDRKNRFISLGAFQQGTAHYVILDDSNGSIKVFKEQYE